MSWSETLPEGNESAKVHDRIAPYIYGHGLDIGCGCWKLKVAKSPLHSCLGVDGGYSDPAIKEADIIADVTDLSRFASESFDYLYSSHTLEDMHYPEAVLREWWRLVKVGGNLILYLPLTRQVAKALGREDWENFYPDKGDKNANMYHQHDFFPAEIKDAIGRIGRAEVLADEIRGEKDEYSFLQVFRKLASSNHSEKGLSSFTGKRALVVRYGAIGDMIQSMPVLKKLKEEGYHVTVNCAEVGREVLKNCPYVDEVAIQIQNHVENKGTQSGPLAEYWKELEAKYDKFVNLTGAAEESLLFPDGRLINVMEALKKDHSELNEESAFFNTIRGFRKVVGEQNYYDNHLKKAGYSDTGMNGELFFSEAEELMAQGFRDKYPGRFMVLWSLSGSSYHKRYPYFQQVAQELVVRNPDILLISVGDKECSLIERAESNRYLPRSGKWNLRTTLAMTKYVDLVVGPETGILNASGCFDTPKITFLSHSSHDNLCKYWKNDFCLAPDEKDVFCHPCHTLHYVHNANEECQACHGTHTVSFTNPPPDKKFAGIWTCPYTVTPGTRDGQGAGIVAPLCTLLPPERVLGRINEVYALWKEKRFARELVASA